LSTLTGSVGMFGEYGSGDLYGRDGNLMITYDEFGFEWQIPSRR